ncbi:hypothetical protein [Nocardioides sp. 503]|uniref:hypothetical protein n=1 Tax=Nocardioides sp. 503 TaxID=2508326 RepID=UPI0010702075|nr:hypothetical protein [Nocardioides sp. 503]
MAHTRTTSPETATGRALAAQPTETRLRRWPSVAIAWSVGLFCLVVTGAWVLDHLVRGAPVDETGWIVAGATVLRVLTILVALAAVQRWGRRIPARLLSMALWGCAAAQLVYPAAEAVVKSAVLTGLLDAPDRGLGNMSAVGWFNFAAVWLIFGIPGLLFALAARDHDRRRRVSWVWPAAGLAGGVVALFAIGALIS